MTPIEIKVLLLRRELTIAGLATKFGCYRQQLSMVINGKRVMPHLRQKLADELDVNVEQLFGTSPRRKAA